MCLLYEENADRDSHVLSLHGDVDISNVGEFEAALTSASKARGPAFLERLPEVLELDEVAV